MSEFEYLITVKEAAKKYPFAEKTFRNWRSCGINLQIFVKVSGRLLIDTREMDSIVYTDKQDTQEKVRRLGL